MGDFIKPFCNTYISFLNDLHKLYDGPKNKQISYKLKKQTKWVMQMSNRGNPEVATIFSKNIEPYRERLLEFDETLFTGPDYLKLGRIRWDMLSKQKSWESVDDADKEAIWKYLNTLIITSQTAITHTLDGLEEFVRRIAPQQQAPQQGQQGQQAAGLGQFMEDPAIKHLAGIVEQKLKQRNDLDLSNPMALMQQMMTGELDLSDIQNDIQQEIDKECEAGNMSRAHFKQMEQDLVRVMETPEMVQQVNQFRTIMQAGQLGNMFSGSGKE